MDDQRERAMADVIRGMAAQIAEGAPQGWKRGWVHAYRGPSSSGHRGAGYEMSDGSMGDLPAALGGLNRLYKLSGASPADLTVDLAVDSSGRFEAVTSRAITRDHSGLFLYVLRPDVLPREPGADQDPPSNPAPAGDPDEAVRLFREYVRRRAEIIGEEFLPEPLDPAERAALLDAFPGDLPPDLVALYGEADGDDETGLFHNHLWFPLESTTTYVHHRPERRWTGDPLWSMTGDAEPFGTIRRQLSSPRWIPFATSTGGDYLAVDMDPGPAGRPGQVIRVGIHYDGEPVYVADSVTTMLRRLVEALDRGDYEDREGYLDVYARLPSYLDDDRTYWRGAPPIPKKTRRIQSLVVDKVRDLDLESVRGAPHLRMVALFGEGPVDLEPLRDVPLEALRLELDAADLSPLAGHPTLRAVTLGTRDPVDLGVLRTFPRLEGLELAEGAARDLAVIGELDGLLSLTLSPEQWRRLGEPPPLAAAGLNGDPTPGQVSEWAALFEAGEELGGCAYFTGLLDGSA
ncbi:SMI1/KNR4 family protein [Nonomuraea muscovyensis]|uniref:Cell wall assembly regulator SMI1 n=1 Tax=Nonomuraea muscovyensis TaxID=1124761 RepID=A0A7X0CBJ4_9ACTN|nr:SMI1/KNR4 family protein [Nonomuraea muscovyensis]MBB6351106.1 cell wall assembly regulator SMI1 [Nonomuraea muscovyensis]